MNFFVAFLIRVLWEADGNKILLEKLKINVSMLGDFMAKDIFVKVDS